MNQDTSLEVLRDYRPLLLACEAIGWLHMAGKANIKFLQKHGGYSQVKYDDRRWYEELAQISCDWDKRLYWVREKFAHSCQWPDSLTKFLSQHRDTDAGLLGLLQAGHGVVSGIEKNLPPERYVKYLEQDVTNMWLSTAFGHPVRNLLADPPDILTEEGWKKLLNKIYCLLMRLEVLGTRMPCNIAQWWNWREKAVGKDGWLRKAFDRTLAETRLPNNEVTLFDQSYVAAALFKSAVAGALLEGDSFPWDCGKLKQRTCWRLLTVGLGMDHFEARAVKIGDWTGIQQAAANFFAMVRQLVEVEIPVGALLYQDSSLCVFSFPGERYKCPFPVKKGNNEANECLDDKQGKKKKEERCQWYKGSKFECPFLEREYRLSDVVYPVEQWQKEFQGKIDALAIEMKLELPVYVHISSPPSRSLAKIWQEMKSAREALATPHFRYWQVPCATISPENSKGHVCSVCQVRLNHKETKKAEPCSVCKERRTHRLEDWLSGKTGLDTIWISEVADHNDRLALITMHLDIEPWLEGSRLDSLRTQAIPEWRANNTDVNNTLNSIAANTNYDTLLKYISQVIQKAIQEENFPREDVVFRALSGGFSSENDWPTFFNKIVEDRAAAKSWNELNDDERAAWLTHQLLCKLSSPGRLYRFWRQSEAFFQELLKEFRGIVARDPNRWRVKRLRIIPDNNGEAPKDKQPYNGRLPAGPISLLYRKDTGDFLTICNLARLLKPEQSVEDLPKTITVQEDDSQETLTFTVKMLDEKEKEKAKAGVYYPLIPLELSPVRFRVLVPLAAANECVNTALAAWREQFVRVWDRLPLRIGVIAFSRLTPFQAVIEAARNVEAALAAQEDAEEWEVVKCEVENGVAKLQLQKAGQALSAIRFDMPIQLPDGREDVFYPYLQVNDELTRFPHDFKTPEGKIYRHVKNLQYGDVVYVYPAQIATVYLSSTTLRFEPVAVHSLAEWEKMQEIWQEYIVRRAPSETAVHGAWEEMRQRWEEWHGPEGDWLPGGQEAWQAFVRATLARLFKRKSDREKSEEINWKLLTDAAVAGLLDWSLEWHLRVLKLSLPGGEQA